MRVALIYDMDACRTPTGVTRHALAQLEELARRPDIALQVITGRMTEPDGLAYWESLASLSRRELPLRMRNALRWWRLKPWPPVDWWSGPADWVYCPSEYFVPTRRARRAVTSHDVLQNLQGPPRMRARLARVFGEAHLILSVSQFNTARLLEEFPDCAGRVAYVPNGAEDLFFEPATARERAAVRSDLGLPPNVPYLLSVANFQPRKNLVRLIRGSARLPEVARGDLALVLLGTGAEREEAEVRNAAAAVGPKAIIRFPGYRQGRDLRAAYSEAAALVFPSLCESFGIPAVEAMAQGVPVALANSTALPEIGGEAGWYFSPENEDSLVDALRNLLDQHDERGRRAALGRTIAERYRWRTANDRLVDALGACL
jgi:alpha-1,3-rhamnosyl/mannosyltransferase